MAAHTKPDELRKVPCGFRLPQWILDWMRDQPVPQPQLIEHALCKTYNLTPPEVEDQ